MQIACPSCGAETVLRNPASISYVCEYCDTTMMLVDRQWTNTGRKSRLSQGFSRFYVGAVGTLQAKSFEVLGRVRYSFGDGFWDEWYLIFEDASTSWMTEDNHEFCIQSEVQQADINPNLFQVGDLLHIQEVQIQILEVGFAKCLGVEGELPANILPNEEYAYADGSSLDGKIAVGFEFDDEQPTIFMGKWIAPQEITMHDDSLDW